MGKVIEGIQDVVSKKMDNKDTDKLDIMEKRVLKLVETMEIKRTDDRSLLGCVEKMDEDQEESNGIMKRRSCVVVHGIKESTSVDSAVRNAQDEDQIVNLLHQIKCDSLSVKNTIRLGRRFENPDDKPRPKRLT